MNIFCRLLFLLLILSSCNKVAEYPNLVFILADDMGYGDLSSLNPASKIITPNMDRIAAEGMVFIDAHSGSAVCTPTRYGILTGRYSWRSRLKQGVTWSWDQPLIEDGRQTVASLLQQKGYSTACIGKWHLGLGWTMDTTGIADFSKNIHTGPNDNGFDYSFIIPASLDIPPYVYIEDKTITAQPDTITENNSKFGWWRPGHTGADFEHKQVLETFTDKAVAWIESQADEDEKPFFLYLPLAAPHTPILPTGRFEGISNTNPYGDFVVMVDHMIGRILDVLEKNELSNNTIVIVTSDNGCSPQADFAELASLGHDPSYIYRGHKADIFEGGHRVPFLVRWPGKIKPGLQSEQIICLTDLMATMSEITGAELKDNEGEDSYSFLRTLLKNKPSGRRSVIHHSVDGYFAIRKNKWKLEICPGSGGWSFPVNSEAREMGLPPVQLYNLYAEPEERENVVYKYPAIADELYKLLKDDIYRGRSTPGKNQQNAPADNWPDRYLTDLE